MSPTCTAKADPAAATTEQDIMKRLDQLGQLVDKFASSLPDWLAKQKVRQREGLLEKAQQIHETEGWEAMEAYVNQVSPERYDYLSRIRKAREQE
jgi:D-mannonate dehydratase